MLAAALVFLRPIGALLAKLPWWAYVAAALGVSFWIWLGHHDRALVTKTESRVDAVWIKKEKDAADLQAAQVNHLRGEIADWVLKGLAWRDELSSMLDEEGTKRRGAFDLLAKERAQRVTPQAVARCDLTRGVIVQFNAGANAANGVTSAAGAPEPAAALNDTSSGVSLDRYAGAVELTQAHLGICREQVIGWQRYCGPGGVLDKWYEGIREKVEKCFPQPVIQQP